MTRSKAPLAMMEQMVMLLVFALAAALCLQAFVKSDSMSKDMEARDRAMVLCQNTAEAIRSTGGAYDSACDLMGVPFPYPGLGKEATVLYYDEDWTLIDTDDCAFKLWIVPLDSGADGLGKARISVEESGGSDEIFAIEVAWQEEVGVHG